MTAIIGAVTSELHDFTMANAADEPARSSSTIAAADMVIVGTARRALAIAQDAAVARACSSNASTNSISPRRFATNWLTRRSESQPPGGRRRAVYLPSRTTVGDLREQIMAEPWTGRYASVDILGVRGSIEVALSAALGGACAAAGAPAST